MATNTRVLRLDPDFESKWKKGWAEAMPNTAYHKVCVSEDERVLSGIFCMEPARLEVPPFECDEMCTMIEGELTTIFEDGSQESFWPGNSFMIPRNTAYTWVNEVRIKKAYVIIYTDVAPSQETKDILG